MSDSISVNTPEGASPADEQRIIDAAVDRKIEKDLDDLLGSF